eukprot:478597-Pyramimonas_sp.AAC.1
MDETKRGKGVAGGMRSASTVKRLKMYKQRAVHDKKGKLLKQDLQSRELPNTRIVPDRRSVPSAPVLRCTWYLFSFRYVGCTRLSRVRVDVPKISARCSFHGTNHRYQHSWRDCD